MKPDKTHRRWCVVVGQPKYPPPYTQSQQNQMGEICLANGGFHDYDSKKEAEDASRNFINGSWNYEVVENTLSQTPVKVGNFTINIQHPIAVTSVAQKVQEILDGMKDLSKPLFKSSAALSDATPLENNAVCRTCKNDRLSSSERSCWRCGSAC